MIAGVELVKLVTHSDDRGHLTEIYRTDMPYHDYLRERGLAVAQVYLVEDPVRGTVRAFHKHAELWDFFSISHGSAKFILVDDRDGSPTKGNKATFVLTARNMGMLVVPPGVYHGWMSLEDDTILVSIASHTYNAKKPDETRVPPHSFDTEWKVEFK